MKMVIGVREFTGRGMGGRGWSGWVWILGVRTGFGLDLDRVLVVWI